MSAALALHMGSAVVLVTDSRTTMLRPQTGEILGHFDGATKIVRTRIGLVTGTGYTNLLSAALYALEEHPMRSTDDLIATIQRTRDACHDEVPQDGLLTTGFIGSFLLRDKGLQLWKQHPSDGSGGRGWTFPPGQFSYLLPARTREECDFLEAQLQPLYEAFQFPESEHDDHVTLAVHNAGVLREGLARLSAVNDSISRSFQVGIHVFPMLTGISGVVAVDDPSCMGWLVGAPQTREFVLEWDEVACPSRAAPEPATVGSGPPSPVSGE